MPEENMWDGFFNPPIIIERLGIGPETGAVVEFGCGYGTFSLPVARLVRGPVYAFDVEPEMVKMVREKARQQEIGNIVCSVRDFVTQGTGLPDAAADYVMMFNILHAEQPHILLREARRVLQPNGRLGIMHWNYDPSTPRGPSMSIRPRPEQCRAWAEDAGFILLAPGITSLPPYHYGMIMDCTAIPPNPSQRA